MSHNALLGFWLTCACATLSTAVATAVSNAPDIVLYAADATNLRGNWSRAADASAAGGQLLISADKGWSNTVGPMASPSDSIDFVFNAPAGTAYHVWMRVRAAANSKYNDSVFTQFSDAVDGSGAAILAVGTVNGITVNLASDAAGGSLNGWGWQDGAYWLSQPATIRFAATGAHTLRIQTREDGAQIDQVVLSPVAYLTTAPGTVTSDSTIVPKSAATLPAPWIAQAIGNNSLGGSGSYASGTFVVAGSGADIWGTADAFEFVSQPTSGDTQIMARVVSLQNTNSYAKAGVMLRDTAGAGAAQVLLDVRPSGAVEFMSRSASGAATTFVGGGTQATPAWLKLVRSGAAVSGWASSNGVTWTLIGSTSAALATSAQMGLAVTSHDVAQLNTATFDNVAIAVPLSSPAAPTMLVPANGATGRALNTSVTWGTATATTYDLSFDTKSPPAGIAINLTGTTFTPAGLRNGTIYYWQVTARNAGGSTPGPVWSFTTVAASATSTAAPTVYNAISDRNPYVKPALPQLGGAGYSFNDPTFGSRLLRVTDGGTRPGLMNRSYRVPSNAHLAAWNASSTAFFVESNDGTVIPFTFDPATMTASRLQPVSSGNGGLTLSFYVEPQFSLVNPNLIYGVASGGNNRTVTAYDFTSGAYTPVLDLDTIAGGLAGTYVGGMMTGGVAPEDLMVFFGGTSQDAHFLALWAPISNLAARKVLNTASSTINGRSTSLSLNFHLHSAQIDKSGRYVFLYPTGVDLGAPRYASQVYVWDTQSDNVVAITSGGKDGGAEMHPGGHDAAGFGYWINQDCCTSSSWDAAQWQFRDLAAVGHTNDLISPVLATKEIYLADHTSWNNARPDALVPVISSTYRYGTNTAPWRAWDEEIIGIDTTAGIGGIVYRFAHHRSIVASDADPSQPYFWYEPIANVSPDGQWVLFTSNWEKTLGTDAAEGTFRQDVFVVHLTPQ